MKKQTCGTCEHAIHAIDAAEGTSGLACVANFPKLLKVHKDDVCYDKSKFKSREGK